MIILNLKLIIIYMNIELEKNNSAYPQGRQNYVLIREWYQNKLVRCSVARGSQ